MGSSHAILGNLNFSVFFSQQNDGIATIFHQQRNKSIGKSNLQAHRSTLFCNHAKYSRIPCHICMYVCSVHLKNAVHFSSALRCSALVSTNSNLISVWLLICCFFPGYSECYGFWFEVLWRLNLTVG